MEEQVTEQLNGVAKEAVQSLKDYFETGNDSNAGKANMALKLLGRINGNDAYRLKMLALQFSIARQAGIKGDHLRPLLGLLNPSLAEAPAAPGSAKGLKAPVEVQSEVAEKTEAAA